MKQILTARLAMMILTLIAVLLINGMFVGCSGTEDPMRPADSEKTAENRTGVSLAMLKTADQAPGAPQAPGIGVPSVKEVSFYHDWKLTQEVQESVSIGDTIFVKVVFSEPMKHVVADDKSARPILYYRRVEEGQELVRFRIAPHGAGGEDFVSGDAKPFQSGTNDYICKYTVVPEDEGKQISFMIGRFSVDLEGVPLPEFYRHKVKLQVDSTAPEMVEPEEPVVSPPTIIQQVPRPVPGADDFVGAVYIPDPGHNDVLRSGVFPVPGATVVIVSGSRSGERVTTDQNGRYVFRGVAEDSLHLRVEKSGFEPKEVIVHRTEATTLADGTSLLKYIADPQHLAGNILVGHRIPSAARSILDRISVVSDLLYIDSGSYMRSGAYGVYMNGVAVVQSVHNDHLHIIAHEFFHAHQHALTFVDGWFSGDDWLRTPEGRAYVQAKEKDIREFGKSSADHNYEDIDVESSAQVFGMYWTGFGDLKERAPHRYRWAEKWFGQ